MRQLDIEVEALKARIKQLEAALRDIRSHSLELYATGVARAALEEEKSECPIE
jgi:hypothetical protein